MLSNEKAPNQGSENSLFLSIDEDLYGETPKGVQKKVKCRIVVCVGLLAVVLLVMRAALIFTLIFPSLYRKENVTFIPDSTITEDPSVSETTSAADFRETVHNYRVAAKQGDAKAQFHLGFMYLKGQGVPQSDKEAVKWFKKSAEQGDPSAQYNLGIMYWNGWGMRQSKKEAGKWFRKSAVQGNADSQLKLGWMYENGNGVKQSHVEAVKFFRQSAKQGNAEAQFNLGLMYDLGLGVPRSDKEAVKWYRKSLEQRNA